jgi:CelD/BcsL family acetyltransferase involved in cellulose biosynthesis
MTYLAFDRDLLPATFFGSDAPEVPGKAARGEITMNESKTGLYHVTVLRGDRSLIDSIADEWRQLCTEEPSRVPFYTPEWHRAWLAAFAPAATLVLIVARRDGQLRGVLPLLEERIGIRGLGLTRLRAPSNFYSGRADLVYGERDASDVTHAIWATLAREVKWDLLEYREVPEDGGFAMLAAAAAAAGYPVIARPTIRSPFVTIQPGEDVSQRGPAKRMRRAQRGLAKLGGYTVRRTAPADVASLDRLLEQEAAGWKGSAGTAIACDPAATEFYTNLITSPIDTFTPVINEIVFNGVPIAINLGIEMGTRYFDPKRTYDETLHRYCPGHLISHEILLGISVRGFTEFDMLGHDEAYKMQWTSDVRRHYHYLIFGRSLKGAVLRLGIITLLPLVHQWRTALNKRHAGVGRASASGRDQESSGPR